MGLPHRTSLKFQSGSAIIFAMGMSLLVSALSVALLLWMMLDIRRVEQLKASSERVSALEISESMAAAKIHRAESNWHDPWEFLHHETPVQGRLSELSSRININTLYKRDQGKNAESSFMPSKVIERLLETNGVDSAESLVHSLEVSGNQLFGISNHPDLKPAADFLYAADPEIQQVNINSTSPEVLSSILDIPMSEADAILSNAPFESIQDIINILAKHELKFEPITPIEAWFSVEGQYYVLETRLLGKRNAQIYSIFRKNEDKITLLWRSWGSLP